MTIRDKVKEEIAKFLFRHDCPRGNWNFTVEVQRRQWREEAKQMIESIPEISAGLDMVEKGYNAKVDRDAELPKYRAGRAVDTWIAVERKLYEKAQQDMKSQGWVKEIG